MAHTEYGLSWKACWNWLLSFTQISKVWWSIQMTDTESDLLLAKNIIDLVSQHNCRPDSKINPSPLKPNPALTPWDLSQMTVPSRVTSSWPWLIYNVLSQTDCQQATSNRIFGLFKINPSEFFYDWFKSNIIHIFKFDWWLMNAFKIDANLHCFESMYVSGGYFTN